MTSQYIFSVLYRRNTRCNVSSKGPSWMRKASASPLYQRSSAWRSRCGALCLTKGLWRRTFDEGPLTVWRKTFDELRTFSDEGPSVTKDLQWRRTFTDEGLSLETLDLAFCISTVHQLFYISRICISTLPTQHTTFIAILRYFFIYIYIYTYAIGVHFICQYWNLMLFGN